ncbi:exodeoxyribonuclease VII large subunit [Chloroflexus islandicus]|uniref:Exodeoxyribonuclease 7 large subunit n=1 Tax=Chloroflexus islandicus TaxID=1707952 RepID=A0A178MKE2_9CHLR|nr:exodeoxyribonuclease VII large subunit [Chloroflexus islandicus]OAN48515.1 exodeoxyribonuclease VII large subunit [Chloroflexus islandicus]
MRAFSVSDLNSALRAHLEEDGLFFDLWLLAEVVEFRRYSSGHCYFTLKDEQASIRAVLWRSAAERLARLPANGEAVLAHGRVGFYEARGEVQFVVDQIVPAGEGLLNAQLEQLRARLEAEGLFDERRKRSLPPLPRRIGIVTSLQAAALQDMLTIFRRRYPLAEIVVSPCLVQGELAPASIVAALRRVYAEPVDLVIVARGGGASEDLAAFNDEQVVRAVAASPVPIITGVGHETDTTLVDAVADLRAPTPSAAAEVAAPAVVDLRQRVAELRDRAAGAIMARIEEQRRAVDQQVTLLRRNHPRRHLDAARQTVDELDRRASRAFERWLALAQTRLQGLQARLSTLSPQATLARGYAIAQRTGGQVVTDPAQVQAGEQLQLTVRAGTLLVAVEDANE